MGRLARCRTRHQPRFPLPADNTLRDALIAGINLNIFNLHCERVKMANIAQTINVLQAMILTDKEKMILTPTYHVFEMYRVHHDATLLPAELTCGDYTQGSDKIPGLSVSASSRQGGRDHVSLCNLNPSAPAELRCELRGARPRSISGRVLTADVMQARNTFEKPETVKPAPSGACTALASTIADLRGFAPFFENLSTGGFRATIGNGGKIRGARALFRTHRIMMRPVNCRAKMALPYL